MTEDVISLHAISFDSMVGTDMDDVVEDDE